MNNQFPPNVSDQRVLITLPNDGWEKHLLPGKWEVRVSSDGQVVTQNPDGKGGFKWFANFQTPVTIAEASLYPQQLQVERHSVNPDFSVFPNGGQKTRNRKVTCGPVQPIFGKFGGRWHVLVEENWRHGVIFTLDSENNVTAMHFTAFLQREISRRSLDAFKKETSFPETSFERLNVNLFSANTARNFGIRALHLLRFKDQTMALPIELPWANTKWMPVVETAFDETPWVEIPVSDSEAQVVPSEILGLTYDIWAGYAMWQIVSKGYLPGLTISEMIPAK